MNFSTRFFYLFLGFLWIGSASAQSPALQINLERAYQQWREAILTEDAEAWAKSITRYRQVVTRNLIVSQRQSFPGAVFAVPFNPPETAGLRLLEADAAGETAHLLYFGKVDLGGGDTSKLPESVLMLKFFKEGNQWKFDSTKILKLDEQPEILKQIRAGGALTFLDYPQFTPPGVAPAIPALCQVPDNMTGCTLQSYGYETKMVINGFDYPAVEDNAEKVFVIGGLKNGANQVTLSIKPTEIPEGEERLLQLDFFVLTGKPGKPPVRVYHYQTKDANVTNPLQLPVIITPELLEKGR